VSESKIAVPFVASSPDSEVSAKPQRRIFSAEEKKRILEETDRALVNGGGVGAILRREGLYSSTLHGWRKERDSAVHKAFSQKRGPQPQRNPLAAENERLRRHNQRLQEELEKAHIIIDVQKNCRVRLNRTPAGPETLGICTLVVPGGIAVYFLVFCEPVKKHGLGVARGLESGDVVRRSRLGN
jgi:transposase